MLCYIVSTHENVAGGSRSSYDLLSSGIAKVTL